MALILNRSLLEGMELNQSNLAVVCIDSMGTLKDTNQWVAAQCRVLETANQLSIPIFMVFLNEAQVPQNYAFFSSISSDRNRIESGVTINPKTKKQIHGARIHKNLRQLANAAKHPKAIYLQKRNNNAFSETGLDDLLKKAKRNMIVVMGEMANSCVRTTAVGGAVDLFGDNKGHHTLSAVERGYKVLTCSAVCVQNKFPEGHFSDETSWFTHAHVWAYANLE